MTEPTPFGEEAVRTAFARQVGWCSQLGSPLTAALCQAIGPRLDRASEVGRRVLDWPGNPDALHDSVPLRLCGALHGLVRAGRLPELARLYPPNPAPTPDMLWPAVSAAFVETEAELLRWLDSPPQTNEVARSGVLVPGLAVVAAETRLPLALYELGASAGLNLQPDRYHCRAAASRYGDPASPVRLAPAWTGADPPAVAIRIASRRGVDRNPLDVTLAEHRERLLAYVWPDQADRLERLEAALAIAAADPPAVDRADGAEWLEGQLPLNREAPTGIARVVMHSIAFQYFSPATQERIASHLEALGHAATSDQPLAWLRYEMDPPVKSPSLRLRLWPTGEDRLLALADAHGRAVTWQV